jgi:hypothetical protein
MHTEIWWANMLEANKEMEKYIYCACSESGQKGRGNGRNRHNSDWAVKEQDTQLHNGLASLLSKAVTSE